MAAAVIFALIFVFGIMFFYIATGWRIYQKAGKPGWASIVPIYSLIVYFEIVKRPLWWIFMLFIPLVNIYFGVKLVNALSKAFGKDEGFTVGLIFLSFIFYPILAFGDAKYVLNGPESTSIEGVLDSGM